MCAREFLHVYMCTTRMPGAIGGETRVWEPTWILSVSGVASSCEPPGVGVLWTEPASSARGAGALNHQAISLAHF